MTVNTATASASYDGNGTTQIFTVPFYFLVDGDVKISKRAVDGTVSVLVLNSDYTLTGAGNTAGGSATLVVAPATGETIFIERNVSAVQTTAYPDNGPFPAASHEKALDRLTMLVQQLQTKDGYSLTRDPLGNTYDLGGGTLINSGTAVNDTDLVGKLQATQIAETIAAGVSGGYGSFTQAGAGAVARTFQDKARETISVKDFGAVGDGVADDLASINTALAVNQTGTVLAPHGDYLVSAKPTNDFGVKLAGDGRIMLPITGGNQQLNTKVDDNQHVIGREYLYAWTHALETTRTAKVVCSGDSTTEGGGLASPYLFSDLIGRGGTRRGYNITAVNAGHSSKHTGDWVSTYLTGDLTQAPNLYVVRWGINDPYYGRTLADFKTSLRAGLAQCRATYTVGQMAILLCVPNTTGDTPNGRDEKWYEQVRDVIRQAARDYQCCMIDLYGMFKDPRGGATRWLDNSFGDGRGIHPTRTFALQIASAVNEVLYPRDMMWRMAGNDFYTVAPTAAPSTYPYGWSIYSGPVNTVAWPIYNASVATFRSFNGHAIQFVYSTNSAAVGSAAANGGLNLPQIAIRFGATNSAGTIDAWHEWSTKPSIDLTLQNGWVAWGAGNSPRAMKAGNIVTLDGLVKSGTTAALTTITNLPAGYRPRNTPCIFSVAAGPTTSTTPCQLQVLNTGDVQILSGATTTYVSLSGISFEAGN